MKITGYLFDIYLHENEVNLWLATGSERILLKDRFYPEIFIEPLNEYSERFIRYLNRKGFLHRNPRRTRRRMFYSGAEVDTISLVLRSPSVVTRLKSRLYLFHGYFNIYHADLEMPAHYMFKKSLFPLAEVEAVYRENDNRLLSIKTLNNQHDHAYSLPVFSTAYLTFEKSYRLPVSASNRLLFKAGAERQYIYDRNPCLLIEQINALIERHDPDIIFTSFGDQTILPYLFSEAAACSMKLKVDRDLRYNRRRIRTGGKSFNSYGNVLFRAHAYPFFGRWHIDSRNSFLYDNSSLQGILEIARLSCIPVQRIARSSTGLALTSMQVQAALEQNLLIPRHKSRVEEPKTAAQLLAIDKGGLIFQPDIRNYAVSEKTAQLDFSQMYPTIMVNHNISPETVLCDCCRNDPLAPRVPYTHYHICRRRRGVVPVSLEPLLARRRYLKQLKDEGSEAERLVTRSRIQALKWLLVTCFGYLGYRNAKFGRLESHEAVTAFGRFILLNAIRQAEAAGYRLVQAITDCMFLASDEEEVSPARVKSLALNTGRRTGIELSIEGIYDWLVFLPARHHDDEPVANRYFGRFQNGELKLRGIMCRRKDIPQYIKETQQKMLSIMARQQSIQSVKDSEYLIVELFQNALREITEGRINWQKLLFRKNIGRDLEAYKNRNATRLVLEQLLRYKCRPQPGEKVRYLVTTDRKHPRYIPEEVIHRMAVKPGYDITTYHNLLYDALREIWQSFASEGLMKSLDPRNRGQSFLFY